MRMVTDRRKTCSNEVEKETKEVRNGGLGRRQLMDYGLEWTRMDSDETVRDEWKSDEKAKGDGDETNEKQMKKQ